MRAALAPRPRLWEGRWVKRVIIASLSSGFGGALLGTFFGAWVVHADAPAAPPSGTPAPDPVAQLAERLDAVESALAALGPRVRVLSSATSEPALGGEGPTPLSAPPVTAGYAPSRRSDGQAPGADRSGAHDWANELTMRLGLTPAQTERLLSIRAALESELGRGAPGHGSSHERARAARLSLQKEAEAQLHTVLSPHQVAAYAALDERLRLYRPGAIDSR